ncbi:MAG: thioesterase family protein [Actinomycetota bacterium]|nr:thioesterase family protein [Actinomycetota bacterium]
MSQNEDGESSSSEEIPVPLMLYSATVPKEWVDYNGHMSEWCYLLVMGNSSDAFFRYIGIDDGYRTSGSSLFTVETHIRNLHEVSLGERLTLRLRVLESDAKRVHLVHEIANAENALMATGEQMLIHVDMKAGRASVMPDHIQSRVREIADAHGKMPWPYWVGHVMHIN